VGRKKRRIHGLWGDFLDIGLVFVDGELELLDVVVGEKVSSRHLSSRGGADC